MEKKLTLVRALHGTLEHEMVKKKGILEHEMVNATFHAACFAVTTDPLILLKLIDLFLPLSDCAEICM